MEVKVLALKNYEELLEAERLGVKPPQEEKTYLDMVFLLGTVAWAIRLADNHIKAQIAGKEMIFLFEEELWQRLKIHLNQQG